MHSSHHTKFQPEWWLPDPVRARIDVFRPILASLYTLYKQHIASLYSQHSCCGFSTATMCCCGTATALVWLPHSLCGCHTASVWLPHRGHVHGHGHGHGTGRDRRCAESLEALPPPPHAHTPKIATPRCGGKTLTQQFVGVFGCLVLCVFCFPRGKFMSRELTH